eukprot:3467781-Heterocapsa_arctica.AAC.1
MTDARTLTTRFTFAVGSVGATPKRTIGKKGTHSVVIHTDSHPEGLYNNLPLKVYIRRELNQRMRKHRKDMAGKGTTIITY